MCILSKLHYAKFCGSNLFFSKVIEEKPLGGSARPPLCTGGVRIQDFLQEPQQNQRLPPCRDSHLHRVNYQCAIWKSALIPKPHLPSPVGNGWEVKEDEGLTPVLAKQSAASREILELTVCRCRASKCSRMCCK